MLRESENRKEGQVRIPSGCAISGLFSRSGARTNGEAIIRSILDETDSGLDIDALRRLLRRQKPSLKH